MANICKLFGLPLDILIEMIGEEGFSKLYETGNKIIQSRIERCPLSCVWRPNPYSSNVVGIEKLFVGSPRNFEEEGFLWYFYHGKTRSYRCIFEYIPSTVKSIGILNWINDAWSSFYEEVPQLEKLDITGYEGEIVPRGDNFEMPLENLRELVVPWMDNGISKIIPQNLQTLKCTGEVHGFTDISHTKITSYSCSYRSKEGIGLLPELPDTIEVLDCIHDGLSQVLPNLREAAVRHVFFHKKDKVEGSKAFPNLSKLLISTPIIREDDDSEVEHVSEYKVSFMKGNRVLLGDWKAMSAFSMFPVKEIALSPRWSTTFIIDRETVRTCFPSAKIIQVR